MRKIGIKAALALGMGACAGEPVVGDISQDKVEIVANGAPISAIYDKAEQACDLYRRNAKQMSYRCADSSCIQKVVLFACVPRPMAENSK